jgi:hypothetical protein
MLLGSLARLGWITALSPAGNSFISSPEFNTGYSLHGPQASHRSPAALETSNRNPFVTTSNEAPMSAAIIGNSDEPTSMRVIAYRDEGASLTLEALGILLKFSLRALRQVAVRTEPKSNRQYPPGKVLGAKPKLWPFKGCR